jgi:hypothetical protein
MPVPSWAAAFLAYGVPPPYHPVDSPICEEGHTMSARIGMVCSSAVLLVALGLSAGGSADPAPAPEPRLFTSSASNISVAQALAELARQTGVRVEDARGEPQRTFRLDLKQATFWQALDAIADAAGARVNLYPTAGRITLDRRGPGYRPPPLSYDGRFRLALQKMTCTRDLTVKDARAAGSSTATLEVAWDPDLQPLFLETRPHNVRLVDDRNQATAVPDDGSELAPVDGRISLVFDVHLPALPRTVAKIRSLEGQLSAIVPSKMLTFTFNTLDQLARAPASGPAQTLNREGVTCEVRKVTLDKGRWSVRIALEYPPGMKQLDSNQSWVVNNELALESADGKRRVVSRDYVLESSTPRRAILSYHFRGKDKAAPGKPEDWKVSYRTPANLVEVPIKFAFKDVLLP